MVGFGVGVAVAAGLTFGVGAGVVVLVGAGEEDSDGLGVGVGIIGGVGGTVRNPHVISITLACGNGLARIVNPTTNSATTALRTRTAFDCLICIYSL